MFLHTKLENRKDPIKICFIGCGKFVSMFLAQYNHLDKIQIDSIVDINVDQAKKNCLKSGLNEQTVDDINFSNSLDEVLDRDIEIFIEATGNPIVGTVHAAKIIKNKKHVILVNVEADITCGKYLSDLAKDKGVICSMAYGDQPSLILEQVEWARLNGFSIVCAGKGTKYHPTFEYSTPDTVWGHYGLTKERAEKESGMNPKMFNSFLCGDKSAIEMCAVSNAANLKCPSNGLTFPSVGVYDIAKKMIPKKKRKQIGNENKLIWHLSDDLKRFKDLTKGHHVIMGRKTFESMPKALPNRTNVVITRNKNYTAENITVVDSLENALKVCKDDPQPFIIGGGEIYRIGLTYAKRIELTRVYHNFEGDTTFPQIDKNLWKEVRNIKMFDIENHNYNFSFITYDKIN